MTELSERPENESRALDVSAEVLSVENNPSDEATEKSARDQLKKTSLASLSQQIKDSARSDDETRIEVDARPLTSDSYLQRGASPERYGELRERPITKRSLDQSKSSDGGVTSPIARHTDLRKEHGGKRSCDFRVDEAMGEEICLRDTLSQSLHDEPALRIEGPDVTVPSTIEHAQPEVDDNVSVRLSGGVRNRSATGRQDFEKAGAGSPRRKRSREDLGIEADREQKIAATNENRANRRSDELQRGVARPTDELRPTGKQPETSSQHFDTLIEISGVDADDRHLSKVPPVVAFGAPSTLPRSTAIARPKSDTKDHENNDGGNFAHYIDASPPTLAGKNLKIESPFISPFGTMVPSSNNLGDSIFGSGQSTAGTSDKSEQASFLASTTPEGPPAHAAIPWPSPFATASPLIGKTFGGFVHKSTFGEEFGGGNRLTSFAAPGGDAKLGGMNGTLLPLGSKVHEDDDIEASDTEASGAEDKSRDGENDEADGRFQHQAVETGEDGEESVFSSRASLYAFKGGSWKESGKGIFKLNVVEGARTAERTGRFIMRAHQTYRVLLNAPIIPQMKVGDSRGEEPSAKSFAFAVVEDGKPTPHMVKLSDVQQSQALYHKVRNLQRGDL